MRTFQVNLDCRASHNIMSNGCVKLPYKGFVISIADQSDSIHVEQDNEAIFEYDMYDMTTDEFMGDYDMVTGIVMCKEFIDNKLDVLRDLG